MFDALIKVGGSVCNSPRLKEYASEWAALSRRYRLLFIAGGGLFADQVRALDHHLDLSDSAAHWMAIAAMDQNGYLLADFMRGVQTVSWIADRGRESEILIPNSQFPILPSPDAGGSSSVLLPYTLLRQVDPLPHSWEVTSDSLAAWLAGFAGTNCLVLLKDVPGVYQASSPGAPPTLLAEIARERLADCEVVDPTFFKTLPPKVDTWILSGRHPDRLAELLETGRTEGTRVVSETPAL